MDGGMKFYATGEAISIAEINRYLIIPIIPKINVLGVPEINVLGPQFYSSKQEEKRKKLATKIIR